MNPRKISLIFILALCVSSIAWAQTAHLSAKKELQQTITSVHEYDGPWTFTNLEERVIDLTKSVSVKANPFIIILGKDVYVSQVRLEQVSPKDSKVTRSVRYDIYRDQFSLKRFKFSKKLPIKLTIVEAVDQYRQPVKVKNNVFTFTITE
ncbi:MAG TPA: hypothetical protein DCS93_26310 [Microscillaceae bacterium]|nr:hypothetical protein [Microscillaceae bacterium]